MQILLTNILQVHKQTKNLNVLRFQGDRYTETLIKRVSIEQSSYYNTYIQHFYYFILQSSKKFE